MSSVPSDRRYSQTHEWFQAVGNEVTCGITTFAAEQLTDITFVDLPSVGSQVAVGERFGEIESVKATGDLLSYIDGKVIAVNQGLADNPGAVNSDAFGEGWMIKVEITELGALDKLMDAEAYQAMLDQE